LGVESASITGARFSRVHLHILGICGTFMGGIALIARAAGHRVTGCDANVYPPMSTQLAAQGMALTEGWDPGQLGLEPDVFVVGNVVTRGNPLMEAILDAGLPYVSGPQWLKENVLAGRWVAAVAGTHGKTTTASMLAWILEHAGLAPGFLIGGVPSNFGVSARLTDSRFFVVEADEYDTAFFDKRSKFLHYPARTAVLNNLEFDHADIFPDLAAIETQFHHFVRTLPASGLIVANGADEALARVLARGCYTPVERFGTAEGWSVGAREAGEFEVLYRGTTAGRLAWPLSGRHNEMNALAAVAAARHCGVPPAQALAALAEFQGVRRRMERRGVAAGVTVYDDFAHHPTAIATTLEGLRATVRNGARVLAVLEPRSNTMKMGRMKDRLAASLAAADLAFCYGARLQWDARAALASLGTKAAVYEDFTELVAAVAAALRPDDHVVIMSNGDFGGIHEKLLARLEERSLK
jgi:UDP-N-acetylmuramate: L-alanyl-gamma-D-glutamyl-meso-diaminopimelate ligase